MLGASPRAEVLGNVLPGQLLERRDGRKLRLLLLRRERVAAGFRQGEVVPRPLAGLRKRHCGIRPKSQVLALALDGEPLHPGLSRGGPDHQVEGLPDGVPSGGLHVADRYRPIQSLGHFSPTIHTTASVGWSEN